MRPVEFPQQNIVYGKTQPEYLPLPAYLTPDGAEVTACWAMNWRERLRFLVTGRAYVTLRTFGGTLSPSIVSSVSSMPPEADDEAQS